MGFLAARWSPADGLAVLRLRVYSGPPCHRQRTDSRCEQVPGAGGPAGTVGSMDSDAYPLRGDVPRTEFVKRRKPPSLGEVSVLDCLEPGQIGLDGVAEHAGTRARFGASPNP